MIKVRGEVRVSLGIMVMIKVRSKVRVSVGDYGYD